MTEREEREEREAPRRCTECGAAMREGYVIDDGLEYYCTDGCLRINYTPEMWRAIYEEENGYWTTWPEETHA